jgi:transcriptional regulator with XRE-family HTH domain
MVLHFPERSIMVGTTLRKTLRTRGHHTLIGMLVAVRERAGLTQRDLAARLRRPRSFVGRMEVGERRIDVIEFIEIARALGADPSELFGKLIE